MYPSVTIIEGPNYSRDDDGWEHNAYTVRIRYQGRSLTSPWRAGLAFTDDPTAADIVRSMVCDASSADQDFEDWSADYGYDPDSRKAEATYRAIVKQTAALRRVFGDDLVDAMLDEYGDIAYGSEATFRAGFANALARVKS